MAKKEKPWSDKWEIIEELSGGGQGYTRLVKRKSPSESIPNQTFVLKELKNQTDPERRRRMYREVANLKILDHSGIPKLIESNAEQFDSEVRLYMVTEFIEGETLSQALEKGRVELSVASELVLKLLDIIQYCHALGIVHRDIKPDNIILRGRNLNEPMLIDFGISFNHADLEANDLTGSLQQLGNRFLALPELRHKSSLQRDPRSDITQTCGILYYVLTGLHPVDLQDHKEEKPHQRPEAKDLLSYISPDVLARLNGIFDRAFDWSLDRRWQSTPELRDELIRLQKPIEGLGSVSKPDYSHFFLGQVIESLALAKEIASAKKLPIFLVIYDDNHPTKSKLDFSLGYFLEYDTTKRLVRDHFVQAVQPLSPDVVQYIPADDPLENCLLVVLSPNGTIIRREGVYANPDEGLQRTRELIIAWERISNESQFE